MIKKIDPTPLKETMVRVPGSKSLSHRMLIGAALARGKSKIHNLLDSEDLQLTAAGLRSMGAQIRVNPVEDCMDVQGVDGRLTPAVDSIFLGNSGTSMRLLAGIAALGNTPYVLTGTKRMCQRPMVELLDALRGLGIGAHSENPLGTPPVTITGGDRRGGKTRLDCSRSSQYLSALLMAGALMEEGITVELVGEPVSQPYIDLTLDVMDQFGVKAQRISSLEYRVEGNQTYAPGVFEVEPDLSNAGYFWVAGAITGKNIGVAHVGPNSLQGDFDQVYILEKMGCRLTMDASGVSVCGGTLSGVEVDMSHTPDAVPAIAVAAAFAKGKTKLTNIAHLRAKECDRIHAVASQLGKMGIGVFQGDDFIEIMGGSPHGARIETFDDHRIAMAFSLAGLRVKGMEIENPDCVGKSFPGFWKCLDGLKES